MKWLSYKHLTLFTLIAIVVMVAGCTSVKTKDAANPGGNAILHIADWKDKYPDQYKSYMSGAGDYKEKDGLAHSHAVLRQSAEVYPRGLYASTNAGMGCIACKSADINTLYEQYGDKVWTMKYEDLRDKVVDFYGCYSCHENNPEGTLTGASVSYRKLAGDYYKTLAPGDVACGQCHNALGGYTRRLAKIPGKNLDNLHPYRYGTDADAILKAFVEDGDKLPVDKDGVQYFYSGHPDVEIFQGSTHQSLGLTCASCHMPQQTNESGKQYTSHDASGSPLKNEAALKYCLTCHKSQGIESTDAMVKFVKGKQGDLVNANKDVQASLDKLHGLIVAGTTDTNVDKKARELYIKARWYQGYSNCDAQVPGTKAPHAFDKMNNYLTQAKKVADEGIALYK